MALVVQQDQLLVLGVSKGGDVEGPMSIHQDDLVASQGRGLTEGRQRLVTARPQGHLGFVMEVPSETSLELSSLLNAAVFWVLVHLGFGDHEGSSTTEFIFVLNPDDRVFLGR